MKTIFIGDLHGRSIWKLIVARENADRIIFIGDYFDSFDLSAVEQIHNFKELMMWSEGTDKEVVFLIGNHDYGYFEGCDGTQTSGYQFKMAFLIKEIVREWKHKLQMVYQFDDIICTHAGVSTDFMNGVFGSGGWSESNIVELLNEQWQYRPNTFDFDCVKPIKYSYVDPSGDNVEQSPLWIRPKSLMSSNKNNLRKKLIQVVGHTSMFKIDKKGTSTGGRYWFIDTLDTSGEYLIYEDGKFSVGQTK